MAIYPPHSRFVKDPAFYTSFGEDDSLFGMTDVQEHKKRREIMNPLFSRRAILKLENVVQEKVDFGTTSISIVLTVIAVNRSIYSLKNSQSAPPLLNPPTFSAVFGP